MKSSMLVLKGNSAAAWAVLVIVEHEDDASSGGRVAELVWQPPILLVVQDHCYPEISNVFSMISV